jgi:hypothetical protein
MSLLLGAAGRPEGLQLRGPRYLDFELGEEVALGEDDVLLVLDLDLLPGVLRVEDTVADGDVHGDDVAFLVAAAGADSDDLALVGLLLGGVGDDDAAGEDLFLDDGLEDDLVGEGNQFLSHADLLVR